MEEVNNSELILSNPIIMQKIYSSLRNIEDVGKLFRVCKSTASIFPRITRFRIGEESYKKYKKLLINNSSSMEKLAICIERPFSEELKIPDFNMTRLSSIKISSGEVMTFMQKKVFDINKITKCEKIKKLQFYPGFIYPEYRVIVKNKTIEELSFSWNVAFEGYMRHEEPRAVKFSLDIENTKIKKLLIRGLELVLKNTIIPVEIFTMTEYWFSKGNPKLFAERVDNRDIFVSSKRIECPRDLGWFIRTNIERLNKHLKGTDNKMLTKVFYKGFCSLDESAVLDLRMFEKIEHVNLELFVIKDKMRDIIEIPEDEELFRNQFGQENHLIILLPHGERVSVEL